jgi:hypothetical protein
MKEVEAGSLVGPRWKKRKKREGESLRGFFRL